MKSYLVYFFCSTISVLLFSSCTDTSKPATLDLVAAKKAIEARNKIAMDAINKGDTVGFANCYTVDAKFMASNSPTVIGRSNIQSAMSEYIKAGFAHIDGKTTDVWGNESLLAEEGTYTLTTKDGSVMDHGKYLDVWKMEDGVWKVFRDCSISDVPMPMPMPEPKQMPMAMKHK